MKRERKIIGSTIVDIFIYSLDSFYCFCIFNFLNNTQQYYVHTQIYQVCTNLYIFTCTHYLDTYIFQLFIFCTRNPRSITYYYASLQYYIHVCSSYQTINYTPQSGPFFTLVALADVRLDFFTDVRLDLFTTEVRRTDFSTSATSIEVLGGSVGGRTGNVVSLLSL